MPAIIDIPVNQADWRRLKKYIRSERRVSDPHPQTDSTVPKSRTGYSCQESDYQLNSIKYTSDFMKSWVSLIQADKIDLS
jgi:hypothetical protein